MDALPFEYCGWNAQGIAHWSRGFPQLFGLNSIQNIRDIQQAILPSDAAALEGMVWRLQKEKEPFSLNVKTHSTDKILTIHGTKGRDLNQSEAFDVLWVEDTSERHNAAEDMNDDLKKLKKDVTQYRTLLDMLSQPIWITDQDSQKLEWCNEAYTKLSENTRDESIGKAVDFKVTPMDKSKSSIGDLITKSSKTSTPCETPARIIIDGKRRVADIKITPHKREGFVVGVANDITEQEELRSELKRYVSSNAKLLEQLTTSIAIFNADQSLEFYNQSFSSLWGLEDQWLNSHPSLGDILEKLRDLRRLPEQADFRAYKKTWIDLFTTLLKPQEDMLYLPDGHAIRYMITPHPMGGLMMTFEDVTSRLELESSYNTLIAVQRETLDNLSQGVVVYGSDARLRISNPTYCKLWDLNPEDLEGHPHISEIVAKKKSFFKGKKYKWDDVQKRLCAHAIERSDIRETLRRSDNTVIECLSAPLPDGGVIVTYRDATDSVRVQQILEEKNQALEEAEKLKTDFLAKVSYQLRTPLNAISGFSEILDQEYFGEINDKQREYTSGIIEAASRLSTLINDILDLSSIEAGFLRLEKDPVDISEMMNSIYDLSRDWAGMDTLQIYLKPPKTSPGTLVIDERRVKQALLNIIRNAINFTPSGGKITLVLDHDDAHITIKVIDTGVGMNEDEQDGLFEPFKTIQTENNNNVSQDNTGLGLSLAKNIITMHKGTINVDSIEGTGTTVTVTLPKS